MRRRRRSLLGRSRMPLSLGPIPPHLRELIRRWIEEDRQANPSRTEAPINALIITGGPGGCSYLDADGEVWDWYQGEDGFTRVEDGPRKVGTIAIAAAHRPELAAWLPTRPRGAPTCPVCAGGGWLPPPHSRLQCPECVGLGWLEPGGRAGPDLGSAADEPA